MCLAKVAVSKYELRNQPAPLKILRSRKTVLLPSTVQVISKFSCRLWKPVMGSQSRMRSWWRLHQSRRVRNSRTIRQYIHHQLATLVKSVAAVSM